MSWYSWLCLIGVPSISAGIVGWCIGSLKNIAKSNKALRLGVQALLRDRLLQAYHYYMKKGYLSFEDRANIKNMYDQYHSLGANGVMDEYYKSMMDLPKKEAKEDEN